jgi:hypothetical protein
MEKAMTTDIFIRTYYKDIPWLEYCIKSIKKFVSGYRQIVIVIPEGQKNSLDAISGCRIETCPVYSNDYIGQQLTKMKAITYTDADKIMFADSDLIWQEAFDVNQYMYYGKPVVLKESFENFKEKYPDVYQRKVWLSKYLGYEVKYEYMRRHPFLFERKLLTVTNILADRGLPEDVSGMSEFNIMGSLADTLFHDNYFFLDTEKGAFPKVKVKQYWSWGGLTPEIVNEIEKVLS